MASHNAAEEQAEPFLDHGRTSHDIELSQYDGERDGDRTPAIHYEAKATTRNWRSGLTITVAMILTVLGFAINLEATEWFEIVLGWKKPIATMYITHSSLTLPWLVHLAYLRFQARKTPYKMWVRDYNNQLRGSISSIDAYFTDVPYLVWGRKGQLGGPLDYLARAMLIVTGVLTISGVSWFLASSFTTPGDLTAIYNSSTFFAAVFSIPILKERLGRWSIMAVALSIFGTFVITYGDTTAKHEIKAGEDASPMSQVGASRFLGNMIACGGAAAFGMYEVLFKRWACSSRPMAPEASLPLSLAANALTGLWTVGTIWVLLVILHVLGVETFVWPNGEQAMYIAIAVLSGSSKSVAMLGSHRICAR